MQIGQKFSIAIHILLSCEFFKDEKNTSEFLAGTIGTNPVIVRNIIRLLKSANLINVSAGTGGDHRRADCGPKVRAAVVAL